ncbi:MAG: hypothetical protein MZV70_42800 [Desulfobacterales bacterium]|nr:hypothetical protein [Desulfobacterales bacterium]
MLWGESGAPEEVASAIDWLLDAEQAWVTRPGHRRRRRAVAGPLRA